MRRATLLSLATVSLLLLPGAALGHLTHQGCTQSRTVVNRPVHVDSYELNCSGITFSLPQSDCLGSDIHVGNAHILLLWETDCQTGVIFENVDGRAPVPLAP